jgi:uncharacterized protein YjbI with pentapeptide repeats
MADNQSTTNSELLCPVDMGRGYKSICNRPLHPAPTGVDEQPVCLMHSNDPAKQSSPLYDAFIEEFESILEKAGDGEANFKCFVFPVFKSSRRTFKPKCNFNRATFTQYASFYGATFNQGADFTGASFLNNAAFFRTAFTQGVQFYKVIFFQDADFILATFGMTANFADAQFKQQARSIAATFKQDANFTKASFAQGASFAGTEFIQDADFDRATFTQKADFSYATFKQIANYKETKFNGTADWGSASFLDRAEFRSTNFTPTEEDIPSAIFSLANISNPRRVVFEKVNLSRARFHNCDVSELRFTSTVKWGIEGNRRAVLFEESLATKKKPEITFSEVAHIYHQLQKNYDAQLDYTTANEFHFGEMEMRRLNVPTSGRFLRLRQRFHRNLSMVALYRWGNDYGNNYIKPMLWLFFFLFFFATFFALPGIGLRQADHNPITYRTEWQPGTSLTHNLPQDVWPELRLYGKSFIAAIDTAIFQKAPDYTPANSRGHALALFEILLTSTLFTLTLLAIRRQFRR